MDADMSGITHLIPPPLSRRALKEVGEEDRCFITQSSPNVEQMLLEDWHLLRPA